MAAVRHGLQETFGMRSHVEVWPIISAIVRN